MKAAFPWLLTLALSPSAAVAKDPAPLCPHFVRDYARKADLPAGARAILTGLSIDFLKKARGTLTAEAEFAPPDVAERREHELESTVRDEAGDVVARARARWLVEPGNLEAPPR
jgi:hypothetical protein